jgi:pulcherriminic acid synthase
MNPPDIFSPDFARDPYPHYRVMRDQYPLYFHEGARAYVLSRYQDVELALENPVFTTRSYARQIEPLLGRTIVQLDGREHAAQRQLIGPSFHAGNVREKFLGLIEETARTLIDGFRERGEVELVREFVAAFPVRILAGLLGLPPTEEGRFRTWYTSLLRFGLNLTGDPEVTRAGFQAREELDAYLRPLIRERRSDPRDDLLSMLAGVEVDGQRLGDDEICRFGMLMIFAGGETTEKTLATCFRNLVSHPEQLAAVRADRSLVERAIAESIRYTAPTHMVPRRTSAEVEVSGGSIPAESEVLCFLGSANRDARHYERPDVFDIHRKELDPRRAFTGGANHLAFGAGRHFCLGATLSKFEVQAAILQLLDAMHDIRYADGVAPPDVGLFLRGPKEMRLRFTVAPAGFGEPRTTAAHSRETT